MQRTLCHYYNYKTLCPVRDNAYTVGCGNKHSVFFRNVNSGIRHRQHLRCSALRQCKKMLQEQYLYIFPDARSLRNSLHCSADCNAHAGAMSEYRAFLLCTSFAEACAIKTVSRNAVEFFRGRKQRGKI